MPGTARILNSTHTPVDILVVRPNFPADKSRLEHFQFHDIDYLDRKVSVHMVLLRLVKSVVLNFKYVVELIHLFNNWREKTHSRLAYFETEIAYLSQE